MEKVWYTVNAALVGFALLGGYNSQEPQRLRNTNPDATACISVLLLAPVFALGIVAYSNSRRRRPPNLVRPSFRRNPLNWWGDPLQSLYLSTWIMASMTFGAMLRRPTIGSVGFWTLGTYACFAIGLAVGQIFVYRIHREQIVREPRRT